jgi:hypothetical protein
LVHHISRPHLLPIKRIKTEYYYYYTLAIIIRE